MIMPLLDPEIDTAKRNMLREQIALREEKSVRTIYRYEKQYAEEQFNGLIPKNREKRRSQKLPENWEEIVAEAVQLRKEVPKRSVRQIIVILESEGYAPLKEVLQRSQAGAVPGRHQVRTSHHR